MFERFTERARQVVIEAQNAAREMKHNYIGTEHILLGLIREEEGLAARVLDGLEVTRPRIEKVVLEQVGEGEEVSAGQIPFTPRAKAALELGLREALALAHSYIGTEHLLLGLIREPDSRAQRILEQLEISPETIRDEVVRMLSGPGYKGPDTRQQQFYVAVSREQHEATILQAHSIEQAATLSGFSEPEMFRLGTGKKFHQQMVPED